MASDRGSYIVVCSFRVTYAFHFLHHAIVFMQEDVTVVNPFARKIFKPGTEHNAATVTGKGSRVHPLRLRQYVVQFAILVRHIDTQHPYGINMNVKRVVYRLAADPEFRIFPETFLPICTAYWKGTVVFSKRTVLRESFQDASARRRSAGK